MNVRAKFKVVEKHDQLQDGKTVGSVKLRPVYTGSPENDSFFKWTPAGEINLSIVNEAAFLALRLEEEYYVDFTPAGRA